MPLAEIAKKVGLSTTPCWRRINRLQEQWHQSKSRVALLDRQGGECGRHCVRGGAHGPA